MKTIRKLALRDMLMHKSRTAMTIIAINRISNKLKTTYRNPSM